MTGPRRRTRLAGAVLALGAVLTATGCSSGAEESAASTSSGGSGGSAGFAAEAVPGSAKVAQSTRVPALSRSVVKTADLVLAARDVDAVRGDITRLLRAVNGFVDSERTSHDRRGDTASATLVLRVPAPAFGATVAGLEKLGRVRSSDRSATDVTTEVIDVDERVQTLHNSLDRLQKFQLQASDVADLLRYEDEITTRQAELQSLTARQTYLQDQTTLATLSVQVDRPDRVHTPPDARNDAGFLTGLQHGWQALVGLVVVALTVVGAVLPFVVVVLLGLPLVLLVRTLARRRRTAPPAAGTGG